MTSIRRQFPWSGPAVLAVVTLLAGACTLVPDEATYPIKLNPVLALEATDAAAIDARLQGPLWPSLPDAPGLQLYKVAERTWVGLNKSFEERVIDRQLATNCVELKTLIEAGYITPYGADSGLEFAILDRCGTIDGLREARPARVSYVRDFVMSREAVDVLPVMLDNGGPAFRLCDAYTADRQGVPWGAYDNMVDVEVRGDYELHVLSRHRGRNIEGDNGLAESGGWTTITILAWADFDGDGVEDLLVEAGSYPVTWIDEEDDYIVARGIFRDRYVLTRTSEQAVLRVIGARKYVQPEKFRAAECETTSLETVD